MNTRAILGVALTGVVVLVSCTQDQPSAPVRPTEATLARNTPTSFCSFSTIGNTAKEYFASRTDPVYDLIDAMSAAHRSGGVTGVATNSAGFAVLARLGEAADAGGTVLKSTAMPADGSAFANAVLKCMSVTGYTPAATDPINFADALGANGLFAVRANTQSDAVYARGVDENGPLFGAEPTTDGLSSNWPIKASSSVDAAVSPSGKALFYGWKSLESSEFLSGEDLSSVGFQLHSLPTPLTFSPKIRVGVCSAETSDVRTLHRHSQAVILAPGGELSFCTTSFGSVSPSSGALALATRQIVSWFAPSPLLAAPRAGGGGAGLVDGLSEFGAVTFQDTVYFANTIPKAKVSRTTNQFNPAVAVYVKTKGGTPLADVKVTLLVVGNSGSFSPPADSVRFTDSSGLATFSNFYLNKAGGYTITAASEFGTTALSNLFNVSGQ